MRTVFVLPLLFVAAVVAWQGLAQNPTDPSPADEASRVVYDDDSAAPQRRPTNTAIPAADEDEAGPAAAGESTASDASRRERALATDVEADGDSGSSANEPGLYSESTDATDSSDPSDSSDEGWQDGQAEPGLGATDQAAAAAVDGATLGSDVSDANTATGSVSADATSATTGSYDPYAPYESGVSSDLPTYMLYPWATEDGQVESRWVETSELTDALGDAVYEEFLQRQADAEEAEAERRLAAAAAAEAAQTQQQPIEFPQIEFPDPFADQATIDFPTPFPDVAE